MAEVEKAFQQINWDGTVIGEPYVFLTPTAFGLCPGFLLKQETLGLTFIASQVPLEYMHEDIDWDARTDSEAMSRIKKAVAGIDPSKKAVAPMFAHTSPPWQRSKAGNMWRTINGFRCTVFTKNKGGRVEYSGIISDDDDKKVWTKTYNTEKEAQDYIDANWSTLITELE